MALTRVCVVAGPGEVQPRLLLPPQPRGCKGPRSLTGDRHHKHIFVQRMVRARIQTLVVI